MSATREIRDGKFPHGDSEDDRVHAIIKHLSRGDSDWVQHGKYIGVRCHEDPETYRFVIARIVHETEDRRV